MADIEVLLDGPRQMFSYLRVAADMESVGYRHYLYMRDICQDREVRALLMKLAMDEVEHRVQLERAEAMLQIRYPDTEEDPDTTAQLRERFHIYPKLDRDDIEALSWQDMLEMAIETEVKSIEFYQIALRNGSVEFEPLERLLEKLIGMETHHRDKLEKLRQ